MHLFQRLIQIANSADDLSDFLEENIITIYDYERKHFVEMINSRQLVEDFIVNKGHVLAGLDYSKSYNRSFIVILYDLAARFGVQGIERLESVVVEHKLVLGERLEGSKLYLLNVRKNKDLIDRLPAILEKFQLALDSEEDSEEKVVLSFLNYIAFCVRNQLPERFLKELQHLILTGRETKSHELLEMDIIGGILDIDFLDVNASDNIQVLIDEYLRREKPEHIPSQGYLIEAGSRYCEMIAGIEKTFEAIRQVSVNLYSPDDDTFYSLGKGVTILDNENQLLSYMYSYGNMHYKKLQSAFELLPKAIFNETVDIVDWGCGQALATISYCDYLISNGYNLNIREAILIDPSVLAVSRAAANAKIFDDAIQITTINKKFDVLEEVDFIKNKRTIKLHLFSNILDVQLYSLQHLIEIVETNFPGENYFVCVSPFISDERNGRLDAFEKRISERGGYEHFGVIHSRVGSWIKAWSRYIRVFKAVI